MYECLHACTFVWLTTRHKYSKDHSYSSSWCMLTAVKDNYFFNLLEYTRYGWPETYVIKVSFQCIFALYVSQGSI